MKTPCLVPEQAPLNTKPTATRTDNPNGFCRLFFVFLVVFCSNCGDLLLAQTKPAAKLAQKPPSQAEQPRVLSEEDQRQAMVQQFLTAFALSKNNLGVLYYATGNLDSASVHLQDAIRIAPNFAIAHLALGLVYYAQNNRQQAISEFKASADGDTVGQRRMNMVPVDTVYSWAKAQFDKRLQGAPNLPAAHMTLGMLYAQGSYLADAEHHLLQAVAVDSMYVDAYNNLGKLYADTQRFEEAVSIYEKALTLPLTEEQKPKVYLNLGVSYMGLNRSEEAIRAWKRSIELSPDYAEAYLNLGIAYETENLSDSARVAWIRAIAVKSDFVAPRVALARLANEEGKPDESARYYGEILALGVRDPQIYGELAKIYDQQEKYDLSFAGYDEALKLDPESSDLRTEKALVQQKIKNRDEARRMKKVRLRQIVTRIKAEAEQILAQLQSGADFVKIAQTSSIDRSAAEGGDLGYFGPGEMIPALQEAVLKLKPGELSDVIETAMGYHILKRVE